MTLVGQASENLDRFRVAGLGFRVEGHDEVLAARTVYSLGKNSMFQSPFGHQSTSYPGQAGAFPNFRSPCQSLKIAPSDNMSSNSTRYLS